MSLTRQQSLDGSELKYNFYFPENACMHTWPQTPCRTIQYPLENSPMCTFPCQKNDMAQFQPNPEPSELYGDALSMNEGSGLYYYHTSNYPMAPLADLTIPPHGGPRHHAKPHH